VTRSSEPRMVCHPATARALNRSAASRNAYRALLSMNTFIDRLREVVVVALADVGGAGGEAPGQREDPARAVAGAELRLFPDQSVEGLAHDGSDRDAASASQVPQPAGLLLRQLDLGPDHMTHVS